MNLSDTGFSLVWWVGGGLFFLMAFFWAIKTAPWYKVVDDKGAQHVLLGMAVLQFILWGLPASIGSGLSFHFLLMTVTVLMFGLQFALIVATLSLLGVTLMGGAGLGVFGLNWFLMGWLPAVIIWWIAKLAYRLLDRNFFVFVLLNGFFAAVVSTIISLLVSGWVMWLSEVQTLAKLKDVFFPYIPMMAIPEGFVSSILIAALVIFKPTWVSCFTDEEFLKGK